ncbi:uncharacterized protein LOC117344830 isoform X2 [Pecten maximus]|uniref:uncharacterized protein LOC117344830 isoform X2 n=1 Tax=Pecten maximus TaxID=6579 RepID=UPI001458E925|nr:uncharacterized protein LOC117344830 isoform X2 [Pecten maximus]
METMESHPELNNLPRESSELPVLDQQNVVKEESGHDPREFEENPEDKNNLAPLRDSETSSIKVIKKKKTAAFQAPNKNIGDAVGKTKTQKNKEKKSKKSVDLAEKGLQDNLKNNKDEKTGKKKKSKNSGDTKEGVESKEVKPKKAKKSKKENDADTEKDSMKEPNLIGDSQVPPSDNSVLEPNLTECNNDGIAKDVKKKETKKTKDKGNDKEPAKSLSDEEWEQLFQSAIDRVLNTPLDQFTQDKEIVRNKTTQNKVEVEERECWNMDVEDDPQNTSDVAVSILNDKQSVGPDQVQENSRDHDFPIEDQHIQMIECAEVQELNENTPEGSELEFNGEEDKKHQHTPVVLLKKAVKKADRSSAAKVLAPRQLQFPKPTKNSEKQGKQKGKKEKSEVSDVLKEKMKNLPEKSEITADHPPRSKKQLLMEREIEETGTWVQCSNTTCKKWRFLQDINDPTEIDEKWICEMNKDTTYNSCEKKEQAYDESEHFYTKYSEGSVVWARMVGYPWWPAMVEIDPDTETFFELVSENSMFPSHYHVVYLDNKVSRAWVKASAILPFHRGSEELNKSLYLTKKSKGPNFKKEVDAAKQNALAALELPTKERLKQFSFSARFKGKWAEEETKSSKVKKHCRVKLTTKKIKNKTKKPEEQTTGKSVVNHDLEMYMLDTSTVDEMLSEEPDSILKGIEDVLDSLGSNILSDDNEYIPTNSEHEDTVSTEIRRDVSPAKESKGKKRKHSSKQGEKPVSKKSRQQKIEGVPRKDSDDNKKQKVKKNKKLAVKKVENKSDSLVRQSVGLAEMKTKVSNVSESDTCVEKIEDLSGENLVKSTTTTMKFDSDIFTMELDDEELNNHPKKKSTCVTSSPPVTPERKSKSKPVAITMKKKSKKNLFAVPDATSKGRPDENFKNSSDDIVSPKKPLENESSVDSELTSEEISHKNDVKCSSTDEKNVNMSSKKKACPKKVSFSAPATVTIEAKATVMPVNKEGDLVSFTDEQTVPDMQTQESDNEDDFSLDLPVCDQKSEIQEVRITSVSTLPVAVDTEDVYDSDPFDLMEE